jgi:ribonuclease Z
MKQLIVIMTGLTLLLLCSNAFAASGKVTSATGVAPDRYAYYPGSEELGPDEMRVVACGTCPTRKELYNKYGV